MESAENSGVIAEEVQNSERPPQMSEPEAAVRDTDAPAADGSRERNRLAKEKSELQDLLQRRQAEFENYRRRMERERSDLFEFAAMDAVKALLPVLDDFERALKVESADKEYARGMELIYHRLFESSEEAWAGADFRRSAAIQSAYPSCGRDGDTKDHPDQTILEEYQRGYYFKGRLAASGDGKGRS